MGVAVWWLSWERASPPANPDDRSASAQSDIPSPSKAGESETVPANPARQANAGTPVKEKTLEPVAKEQALSAWLETQPWFLRLNKSMPTGVTLSIAIHESEDPRWSMIAIREVHSLDSSFDPNVSPTVGIFRVSTDRQTTEWLDPVVNDWDSTQAFLLSREIGAGAPAPAAPNVAPAQADTPALGSPERKAICDAMRDHVISDNRDRALPKFLFKVEFIRVSGDHAGFQGYPVKPDGTPLPDGAFGDMVYTALLKKRNGGWKVVVDLSRSDVPTAEEVREIRESIPAGFPSAVMTDFWRNLLKP